MNITKIDWQKLMVFFLLLFQNISTREGTNAWLYE